MPITGQDLWRYIGDSSAARVCLLVTLKDLRTSKVDQLNVAFLCDRQYNVLRLQVPVDNVLVMNVLQSQNQLRRI